MGYKPQSRMDALLYEICVEHGWCLPPLEREKLFAQRPEDAGTLADALVAAEFGEDFVGRKEASWLTPLINDWLFDSDGRGARSGLPR
jgi:hypothetical protein